MWCSRFKRVLSPVLIILYCASLTTATPLMPMPDESIRADLPLNSELRVVNQRGSIILEVWNEQHVSVGAKVEGGARLTRLPIIIERTDTLLTISAARPQTSVRRGNARSSSTNQSSRVDLILRIPERSRAEIITGSGEVSIKGLPAALNVQTVSGEINTELPATSDADITAESTEGDVVHSISSAQSAADRVTRLHLGTGKVTVNLRSTRGRITIKQAVTASVNTAQQERERKPPTLVGAEVSRPGVGTPATVLTTPEEVDEGDIVRVDTELVTLNVSVVERNTSRGVSNLARNDFRLFEDGVEQQIEHFDSANAPFNLILLIDLSGSTREIVKLIREAALHFVAAARPSDRIAVITFASTPVIVSRLTDNRAALRRSINAIETPQGSTKLYDSIAFALENVLKDAGGARRNAIVLMSDGLDSSLPNVQGDGSTMTYQELLSLISEFDGVLYSLWLNTEYESLSDLDIQPETFDLAYDRMREMAEAGGGMFYEVEKLEDLAGAYERVVADLGTVYSISYHPTNRLRDGKWRSIRISLTTRPNAIARGKRGYYAN